MTGTTKDWNYIAVEFQTDDTGMADLLFRLGGRGSTAQGTATFRDWSLLENQQRQEAFNTIKSGR